MSQVTNKGERDGEDYTCRCGRKVGTLVPHHKHGQLYSLDLGNGNIAETFHGRCGVCGAGIHFEWRWELAAKLFKTDMETVAGWDAAVEDKTIKG